MSRVIAVAAVLAITQVARVPALPRQPEPLTLCVILDVTVSMTRHVSLYSDPLGVVSERARRATFRLARLLGSDDRVRFGRISRTVAFSTGFVSRNEIGRATDVFRVRPSDQEGPSPLWDAIYEALGSLASEAGRRAVIVWTDGRASGNRFGRNDVLQRATAYGIPVYVIVPQIRELMLQADGTSGPMRPEAHLEWLADKSGGRALVEQRDWGDPVALMPEILDELRRDGRR